MKKVKTKTYVWSVLIALSVGGLGGFLTSMGMDEYALVDKPALTPPDILFPIVWTVLYILMGISAARIFMLENSKERNRSLIVYAVQLLFNFFWSIIFFNFQAYGFAFVWLVALWALILTMIIMFSRLDKLSAYLQIPYLLWVSFAGYLNLMVWLLNR